MLSKLHDEIQRTSRVGTGSQQFDNIGMVQLLEKVVLHHQVGEVGAGGPGLEHLDGDCCVTPDVSGGGHHLTEHSLPQALAEDKVLAGELQLLVDLKRAE